jgi:DNA polymerase I
MPNRRRSGSETVSTVVLIDGKNFAYRYHYTHRRLSAKGFPTSVLFGGLQGLLSLSKRFPGAPMVFVWDVKGTTWRHELVGATYKSHRQGPPNPDAKIVNKQIPVFQEFLKKIGMRQFKCTGVECDDYIGILAKHIIDKNLFDEVVIFSSDKDFYQLISKRIKVLRSLDGVKPKFMTAKQVEEDFGVTVSQWTSFRALVGDPSDHIPRAVNGIGPVGAKKLLAAGACPSYSEFRDHSKAIRKEIDKLGTAWEDVHRNYKLSRIILSPTEKVFSKEIQEKLSAKLDSLTTKRFYRRKKKKTKKVFRWMSSWLVGYMMYEMWSRRKEIWSLP